MASVRAAPLAKSRSRSAACPGDDRQSRLGERAVFLKDPAGLAEGAQQNTERLQAVGGVGDLLDQRGAQVGFAVEEHLTLVREVPEERALVDACSGGDLGRGGPVEPALPVQLQSRLLKAAARFCSASWHPRRYRTRQRLT